MNIEEKSTSTISQKFLIFICTLLWFVGFTYATGFGNQYDIFERTKAATPVLFFLCLIFNRKKYHLNASIVFATAIILYILIYNELRNDNTMMDYLWVWLIIPIMKAFTVEKTQIKWIGYIFGCVSTAVLLIGNVTDVFRGWDGNTVSLTQFYSYTVFMAVFADIKDKKNIRSIVIFSAVYLYLISTFNSRSVILFSIVMLLCVLSVIPLRKYLSKQLIFFILLIPLFIAIIITLINDFSFVEKLNTWSYDTFNKPIFNGRDISWEKGFKAFASSPIIGNGNLGNSNYHNSAITCLVAGGSVGFAIWIGACYKILSKGLKWINDSTVYGLTASFLIIWVQQSLEQGLMATRPTVIPYLILGLIYARCYTLEVKNNANVVDNNTNF